MLEVLGISLLVLLLADVALDFWRIWNQAAVERKADEILATLERMRIDLNGKADALLKTAVALADTQGYKRALDEMMVKMEAHKTRGGRDV